MLVNALFLFRIVATSVALVSTITEISLRKSLQAGDTRYAAVPCRLSLPVSYMRMLCMCGEYYLRSTALKVVSLDVMRR